MNEIVNTFMLEMNLKQPGFTYSACGSFTKNKERIQKLKKQERQAIFTKIDLIRLVFNMIWLMEILKIQQEEQLLIKRDKTFNIATNPKYDGYQRGLSSMVYKFFDRKSKSGGVNIPLEFNELNNEKSAKELHKPIIRKFKIRTVYSRYKDNIWVLIQQICN